MFQYAIGCALSLKLELPLKLDTRGFSGYHLHQGFELDRLFNCHTEIASDADLKLVLGWQRTRLAHRVLRRPQLKYFRHENYVVEPSFNYWGEVNNLTGDIYLDGYWQSEMYFREYADEVREDFTFKLPMTKVNAELAKQISQVNAVSLHVRRGDYVGNAKTTATHGLCSLDYYRAAILHITDQIDNPHFFIFSDDIAWVKENLRVDLPHQYIEHNSGSESYNDMRLMSLCQHHIIANSSFSWWGAWLNPSLEKVVVAPKRWFANETNVQDLLPESWVRL